MPWNPPLAVVGKMFALTSDISVNNTTTETSLLQLANGNGSRTIKGNSVAVGAMYQLVGGGLYSTPAVPSNSTVRVKLGSTIQTINISGLLAASQSNQDFWMDADLLVRSIGANGSVMLRGIIGFLGTGGAAVSVSMTLASAATVDLTVDNDIDVSFQWAAAQVGQRVDVKTASILRQQ